MMESAQGANRRKRPQGPDESPALPRAGQHRFAISPATPQSREGINLYAVAATRRSMKSRSSLQTRQAIRAR
jgi:hypothetical protein